ncbi:cation:proton antiporter [Hydrogenivirga sp. 128-5-R1-1]|uniref:cation:proton antiporter domain-containing protein n=1 Tax=Hydrogenivirga sp. 128-5-R1-1 TaxID=392423 RepID=UPI00015F181E|nr:cation:proton antiporter [Hydrogenivirga sp. 128-5-R1-1]EDP76244.1 NA(+)/H(+) antiporter [Hydrogenivirga sp. 128-5-R1-1]
MSAEFILLIVFTGAFFSPIFSRALRMPVPVGELILGLALGHLLGGVQEVPEVLDFLAEFGFLLLMFLAGLEIDFNLIESIKGRLLGIYTLYTFLILITATAAALLLNLSLTSVVILSLLSVGLMLATLRDMGILSSPLAKRVMIVGVIGELVSLFALTLMEKVGRFHGWSSFLLETALVGGFFVGFFLLFRVVKLLVWWFPEMVKKLTYEEDPSAIAVRLSLALMFSTSVIASLAGIESVLGAFLAGAVFSFFIRKKHDLEEKLSSIGYGFLIPIFFIKTGMDMELSSLNFDTAKSVGMFLALMLLVRLIPSPLLLTAGFTPKELITSSLLLSYPFTLMIAGTEIAHSSGLIDDTTSIALYISAALSSLLFPWTTKLLLKVLR